MSDFGGAGAAIGGIAGLAGGLFGGRSGGGNTDAILQAAMIQQASANNAIQNYRDMYEQTRGDLAPWRGAGTAAVNQYAGILNLPGYDKIDPTEYLRSTPGYQFRLGEGIKALDRTAASKGMLMSGPQYKAVNTYGQGLADTTYNALMDRLFGLSGQGLNAAAQTGNAAMTTSGRIGEATMAGGQAQAQGLMNAYNARQSAYDTNQGNLWSGLGALTYGAGKLYNAYGNGWGGGQGNWGSSYLYGSGTTPAGYPEYYYRAKGGPVEEGKPYVVGEEGPEVFMPNQFGGVIPNPRMRQNFYNSIHDPQMYYESKVQESQELGIMPPKSMDPEDMMQYEMRSRALKEGNLSGKFEGFDNPIPMANGGNITSGQPYMVGEQGPEVIVPQRGGFVIPNPMTVMGRNAKQSDDVGKLINVLKKNEDKNFVQRLMKPDLNPVLMDYAGPGTHGTHLMSSGEYDGKGIVYPEIIQGADGNLKRLGRKEAQQYAIKNNEYIQFDTPEEAEWFGKNYKRVWGQGDSTVPKQYFNAFKNNSQHRAEGGPVTAGQPYIVGETLQDGAPRPEILVPAGGDMGAWSAQPIQKPQNWKEKRWNDLEVYNSPDKWTYVDHDKFKDYYNIGVITEMAQAAKKFGINPHTYIAIGIAEGGLGNVDKLNPTRLGMGVRALKMAPEVIAQYSELMDKVESGGTEEDKAAFDAFSRKLNIEGGAEYLKMMIDKYGEEKGLKAYNGLGIGPTKDYVGRIKGVVNAIKNNKEINAAIKKSN